MQYVVGFVRPRTLVLVAIDSFFGSLLELLQTPHICRRSSVLRTKEFLRCVSIKNLTAQHSDINIQLIFRIPEGIQE
jgi:hypothetical protein